MDGPDAVNEAAAGIPAVEVAAVLHGDDVLRTDEEVCATGMVSGKRRDGRSQVIVSGQVLVVGTVLLQVGGIADGAVMGRLEHPAQRDELVEDLQPGLLVGFAESTDDAVPVLVLLVFLVRLVVLVQASHLLS